MRRVISVLLTIVMLFCLFSCADRGGIGYDPNDIVQRSDNRSVYSAIGARVTVDMVYERDGLAYVEVDGVEYELGMDFLSMAMVYNTTVPEDSEYLTREDVYNEWFRLYTKRWNYLMPEIPLYSNEYYDIYSSRIKGFKTGPYRDVADAIIGARVEGNGENSVIIGSSTKLSGAFRDAAFGKSSAGAADLDIEKLTSGGSTVMTDADGGYIYNTYVLDGEPSYTVTEKGTLVIRIRIKEGLCFSDGSPILARHYIAKLISDSTPVGRSAGMGGGMGTRYVGFDEFSLYDGTNDSGIVNGHTVSRYFEGVRLVGDYEFELEVKGEYSDYYFREGFAAFTPSPLELYLGDGVDISVDPMTGAVGVQDEFYRTEMKNGGRVYSHAEEIVKNQRWNSGLAYSGAYVVSDFDESSLVATLTLNSYYKGDMRGVASIGRISYVEIQSATQLDKLSRGEIDVLAGVTGADETRAAIALVKNNPDRFDVNTYDRAGYGKIGFRGDFGPVEDAHVRRAVAYTINRNEFAQAFTGGYGSVVHGAYYAGMPAYKANREELELTLNPYSFSTDDAINELVLGGWIYNERGEEYDALVDRVRYKRLQGYELTEANLGYRSSDSRYRTVKVGEHYYMPLAINWYGTQPNAVTDLLITEWLSSDSATKDIGMYITYTSTDFTSGLYGEYLHIPSYGYDGVPKLSCINFATGFESAVYDYSYAWTVDPLIYDTLSQYYVRDEADYLVK